MAYPGSLTSGKKRFHVSSFTFTTGMFRDEFQIKIRINQISENIIFYHEKL